MIYFYESTTKSTGNFFTQKLKDDLAAGKNVLYIDCVDGFQKHGIAIVPDNLLVYSGNDLIVILRILHQLPPGNVSIFIDHFEFTQADIDDPTIQTQSTINRRKLLISTLVAKKTTECYITSTANQNGPLVSNLPRNGIGVVEYVKTDFDQDLITLLSK